MKTICSLALVACIPTLVSAASLSNYQYVVTSQNPSAYFKLDGTLTDAITPAQSLSPLSGYFGTDAARHQTNAYVYWTKNDSLSLFTDIIPGGDPAGTNSVTNGVGSISLLFRSLDATTNTGQRFIFSQGTGNTTNGNALSLFFENASSSNSPGSLKLRVGSDTTSILASNQIVADEWYYFAMTYNEARSGSQVVWYLGRAGNVLVSGTNNIGANGVVGDNGTLYIGNDADNTGGFNNPGNGRIDEFAVWTRELSANEAAAQYAQLFNYLPANVTYQALLTAQNPAYYFKLDNSSADSITGLVLSTNGTAGTFTTNVLGVPNSAYQFNETNDALVTATDIIPGGGTSFSGANASGTISFLFRTLVGTNNTGQRFIFSQGAGTSGNQNQLALFLENTNGGNGDPNSLKLRVGNGPTTAILQPTSIITNAWYYFAMTYDESRNSQSGGEVRYYLGPVGGVLTNGAINIADTGVVGDNGTVYLGNKNDLKSAFRNPGAGAIDEFAVWNDELSPTEIAAQFAAVTTYSVAQPSLQVLLVLPNVILSWATNNADGFVLESTPSLPNPNPVWSPAGSPSVVANQYFVTNAVSGRSFYRLREPTSP